MSLLALGRAALEVSARCMGLVDAWLCCLAVCNLGQQQLLLQALSCLLLRALSACPVVWTSCFRSGSQTVAVG